MEPITFQNLKVDGVSYICIKDVVISQNTNSHGMAKIVLEVEKSNGEETVKRCDETTIIKIITTASGQPNVLFLGTVAQINLNTEAEYASLVIDLISTSSRLDIERKKRTFQNTSKTHEDIMNEVVSGKAIINMVASDSAIGNMLMQYNETDWEFIKRLASRLNTSVVTNLISEIPFLSIGTPQSGKQYNVETAATQSGTDEESYQSLMLNGTDLESQSSFAMTQVASYQYAFIGDTIIVNGQSKKVKNISSKMENGILITRFGVGEESSFVQPTAKNVQASGQILSGTVKEVKRDKVKVFFDIDSSYDGSTNVWYPYSTAYSSSDGSGWYCMPEIGDTVRVFFPSDNEKDAFASSSVNASPQENTRNKSLKAPSGKEVLLTDDGIYITSKGQKVFINLEEENGITIESDSNINIYSKTSVNVQAEKIKIGASDTITVGTAGSFLEINKKQIMLGSNKVIIS